METALQSMSRNRIPLMLSLCAAGIVIGSIGPWATLVMQTISGVSGDGQVTLVLGIFAGIFAVLEIARPARARMRYISMVVAFLVAAFIGMNTWINVGNTIAQTDMNASVGWGLQLTTIAAMGGGAIAYFEMRRINRNRRQQQARDQSQRAAEEDND